MSNCSSPGGLVHPHPPSPAKIIECLETDKPYIMVATECDMPILKYLTDAGCSEYSCVLRSTLWLLLWKGNIIKPIYSTFPFLSAVYSTEFVFSSIMRQEVEPLPSFIIPPNSCAPAPLRLPPMGAVSSSTGCGGPSSVSSTPSRRTSTGYAVTPPGPVPLTPTQTQVEFASPQTPRIKAN